MYDKEIYDKINMDSEIEELKNELKDLTKQERCIIIEEYVKWAKESNISLAEYHTFMNVLNDLEA